MAPFSVMLGERQGDAQTVALAGEIDVSTALRLEMALEAAIADGARRLQMDLSKTTFMDSTGLASLAAVHRQLRQHGGALTLVNVSDTVRRVLEISAMDRVLMAGTDEP
jgi:anti-sigma B factor antagonist